MIFLSAVIFFQFLVIKTLDPDPGSVPGFALTKNAGSGSVFGSALKPKRIRNTATLFITGPVGKVGNIMVCWV